MARGRGVRVAAYGHRAAFGGMASSRIREGRRLHNSVSALKTTEFYTL